MRILALVIDAFGGSGGIAHYNRALLTALCAFPSCDEVVALPRTAQPVIGMLPSKLRIGANAASGRVSYAFAVMREMAFRGRYDAVFCGHINLLPLAALASRALRAPLVLQVYGIDAFGRPRSDLIFRLARSVDLCLAISRFTRARFLGWSGLEPERCIVLPPTYEETRYRPGTTDSSLRDRLGLEGRRVLLTVGRLDGRERYKGHDAILRVLRDALLDMPDLVFVIAGDGDDRPRLQAVARELGIEHATRFVGEVPDADLPKLYRLADAFAMPSTGEGFGIVFLEAIASGVPVVAGDSDGARDALRDGALGQLVDVQDLNRLRDGILSALRAQRPPTAGVAAFGVANFSARLHAVLAQRVITRLEGGCQGAN